LASAIASALEGCSDILFQIIIRSLQNRARIEKVFAEEKTFVKERERERDVDFGNQTSKVT